MSHVVKPSLSERRSFRIQPRRLECHWPQQIQACAPPQWSCGAMTANDSVTSIVPAGEPGVPAATAAGPRGGASIETTSTCSTKPPPTSPGLRSHPNNKSVNNKQVGYPRVHIFYINMAKLSPEIEFPAEPYTAPVTIGEGVQPRVLGPAALPRLCIDCH